MTEKARIGTRMVGAHLPEAMSWAVRELAGERQMTAGIYWPRD